MRVGEVYPAVGSKISVITATFNAQETVLECLGSVEEQKYSAEHLIIDGASIDQTVSMLKSRKDNRALVFSEPDEGLYDAMNKGISLAQGTIIGILNADDFYAAPDVLALVMEAFKDPKIDACYGDLVYVDSEDTNRIVRYWKSGSYSPAKFYRGWMPPHPTFFVRKSVYERFGVFNLDLGSAADYEIMLRFLLKHKINVKYIPKVLVHMRIGGVSNASIANRIEANKMDRKAWEENGLKPYPWTLAMKPLRKLPQWVIRPSE